MISPSPPAPIRDRLETPLGDQLSLVVQFPRAADRWGQRIALCGAGGKEWTLLRSVEGDDQSPWPLSPPLQCLSIEPRHGGQSVALLLGMAGASHWSASIEPDPARRSLVFELACRVSERPQFLGSHYTLGPEVQLETAAGAPSGTVAELLAGPHRARLSTEALPEGLTAEVATRENQLAVRYSQPFHDGRRTYRWLYRLAIG